jgi:hypothetical protein
VIETAAPTDITTRNVRRRANQGRKKCGDGSSILFRVFSMKHRWHGCAGLDFLRSANECLNVAGPQAAANRNEFRRILRPETFQGLLLPLVACGAIEFGEKDLASVLFALDNRKSRDDRLAERRQPDDIQKDVKRGGRDKTQWSLVAGGIWSSVARSWMANQTYENEFRNSMNHPIITKPIMNHIPYLLLFALNFPAVFLAAETVEYGILTDAPFWKSATWEISNRSFSDKTLRGLFQRVSKQPAPGEFNQSLLLSHLGSGGWKLTTHSIAVMPNSSLHQVWTFQRPGKSQGKSGTKIEIQVTGDWLGGPRENIKQVLLSASSELFRFFPGRKIHPVIVKRSSSGPMVTYKRGPNNEHNVLLSTRGTFWAQYSYQFAHEFCHIMCNYDEPKNNQWFEETVCELASMFAMRRMSETWKTKPPYSNWKSYAPHLFKYAANLIKEGQVPGGKKFVQWFKANQAELVKSGGGLRAKNKIVAAQLLPLFEATPSEWPAVQYLNGWRSEGNQPFDEFLKSWWQAAPEKHRPFIASIAEKFGIKIGA